MDYDDETNFWSTCSVEDFTKTDKRCVELCSSANCDTDVGTNDDDPDVCCYSEDGGEHYFSCIDKCNGSVKKRSECAYQTCHECGGVKCPAVIDCQDNPAYAENCKQFKWACKDSRYPWFKEQCKKTCGVC